MPTKDELITDKQIEEVFNGTSFGLRDHRKLLEQGVLKVQAGYRCGHTLTKIMEWLDLISEKGTVLKKGRRFLFESFRNNNHSG